MKKIEVKVLDYKVFPSDEKSIAVIDDELYHGAHTYYTRLSKGYENGKAQYVKDSIELQFVQKNDDGTIIPGLQNEQLAYILLDRTKKLNARFPSKYNEKMIKGLEMFLEACKERVEDRINRGVMGKLKK